MWHDPDGLSSNPCTKPARKSGATPQPMHENGEARRRAQHLVSGEALSQGTKEQALPDIPPQATPGHISLHP